MTLIGTKNPYPVLEDVNINNIKGIHTKENENITHLKASMSELPVDNNKSIFVPVSKVKDEQTARYYATIAKKAVIKENETRVFTIKTIKDDFNKYLGLRIFRTN